MEDASINEIRVSVGFRVDEMIGEGKFGTVYSGKNVHSGKEIAIKMEEKNSRYPQVLFEAQVLKTIKGGKGIPDIFWSGSSGDHECMVIEKLGYNLEQLKEKSLHKKFSLKTALMLAD